MKEKKTASGASSRPRAKRRIAQQAQTKTDYLLDESRFRALIEHSTDAISLIAKDGRILYVTPSASRISGYAYEERVGVNLFTLIHPEDLHFARQALSELLTKPGVSEAVHARLPRKDGSWMWIEGTATNLLDEPGVQAIVVNYRDVTRRVRSESEISLLQSATQAISEASDFHAALQAVLQKVCETTGWNFGEVWIPRPDGEALELNTAWCCKEKGTERFRKASEGLSFRLGEGLPGRVWATKQPEWVPDVSVNGQVFLRAQIALEDRFKAGVCVPMLVEDRVFAVLGFFTFEARNIDARWMQTVSAVATQLGLILKRKQAEEALLKSEKRFRALIENSFDAIALLATDGTVIYESPSTRRIGGYTPEERVGMNMFSLIHPDDQLYARREFANLLGKPGLAINVQARFASKDGSWRWLEGAATNLLDQPSVQAVVVNYRDVTERKRAEIEVQLLHSATQAIYEAADFDSALRAMLMKVCEVTGWDFGEAWLPRADGSALELSPIWFANRDELKKFRESSESYHFAAGKGLPGRVWANKQPEWLPDVTVGGEIFLRASAAVEVGLRAGVGIPVLANGEVLVVAFFMFEAGEEDRHLMEIVSAVARQLGSVLQRKRVEEKLRITQFSVDKAADAVFWIDTEGRIRYANNATANMFGYSHDELLAMTLFDLDPSYREKCSDYWDNLRARKSTLFESRPRRKDGKILPVEILSNYLQFKGQEFNIAFVRDVSERKQREHEREAIVALSVALRSAMTRAEIMKIILDQTVDLLCMDGAALVMRDAAASDMVVEVANAAWVKNTGMRIPAGQGVSGYVIASGQPYLNNDMMSDERLYSPRGFKVTAAAGVPLIAQGATIGALWTGRNAVISESEKNVLLTIGEIAANAIHRLTTQEQAMRRADEFAALYDTVRDLGAQHELPLLLESIVERAMKLLTVTSGTISLYDSDQQELVTVVAKGVSPPPGARFKLGEGAGGRVAQSRQPLIVEDYQTWEFGLPPFKDSQMRATLQVPMSFGGELIGVLGLSEVGDSTRKFTEDDARLLSLFASQAAGAVLQARLFEEMRRRVAELEAINKVSTAMRAAQTLEEMLPVLLDETLAVLGMTAGIIRLYDPLSDGLRRVAARGWFDQITADLKSNEGIVGHVFTTGQAHISPAFESDSLFHAPMRFAVQPGWGGACVPIRTASEIVGVLFVAVELPREVTSSEARMLTTVAEIAGNAIHRMRLFEQTERRLEHLQAMRTIDAAITSSFDLRVTLAMLLDQVMMQLGADAAAVLLLNPHTSVLEYFAGRGFRSRGIEQTYLQLSKGLAGEAILNRRVIVADLSKEKFARAQLLADENFVAYCVVPFIIKGQPRGVLEIFSRSPLKLDQEYLDFLETLGGQAAVAIDNAELFNRLQRSNVELALAYDATIEGWSQAMDLRDKETEGHTQRVTEATLYLADAMGLAGDDLIQMRRGALLHDIGKMGVPDGILLKEGPLTDEEWAIMRQHPDHAYQMLKGIAYLRQALDIPYCHHEKWDGTGYPRGLKREGIPLVARIFAVIDVWDALRSDRPYRKGWTEEKVQAYIREQSGKHFDPKVVDTFLRRISAEGEVQRFP